MKRTSKETPSSPINPGDLYVFGLLAIARRRGITIDEATTQTVEELRAGFSEEHIEPTRQALKWIKSNPSVLNE